MDGPRYHTPLYASIWFEVQSGWVELQGLGGWPLDFGALAFRGRNAHLRRPWPWRCGFGACAWNIPDSVSGFHSAHNCFPIIFLEFFSTSAALHLRISAVPSSRRPDLLWARNDPDRTRPQRATPRIFWAFLLRIKFQCVRERVICLERLEIRPADDAKLQKPAVRPRTCPGPCTPGGPRRNLFTMASKQESKFQ